MQIFIQAAWHAGKWTTYEENAALKYREQDEEDGCRNDATKMHNERAG